MSSAVFGNDTPVVYKLFGVSNNQLVTSES